jgi:uncharacterized protein YlxP (DUF503 family)
MLPFLPAPDERVHLGVLRIVVRVPGSRSLKDRRRVVASLRDRIVARHRCAFADVGHLESHGAAVVVVATVGNDARVVQSVLDAVRADVLAHPDAVVSDMQLDVAPWPVSVTS